MSDQTTDIDKMPAAAVRALAEAKERRKIREQQKTRIAKEIRGRKGPEPTRFGDWEKNGIVSDF